MIGGAAVYLANEAGAAAQDSTAKAELGLSAVSLALLVKKARGGALPSIPMGRRQVASTLYNAADFAGLDVVERTPYSSQLPYIRPGMDATVWWGGPGEADDLDMKFLNITEGYLLLREYVAGDGHVYAEIWGWPSGIEIEMYSEPSCLDAEGSEWVTHQRESPDEGVIHRDTYGRWLMAKTPRRYRCQTSP